MTKHVTIQVLCNGCEQPYPEEPIGSSSEQWELDLPVRVGDNPLRSLDLCPNCAQGLLELVNSGEIIKRPHGRPRAALQPERPKKKERKTSSDFTCTEPGCGREFVNAHGLSMHRVRMHGTKYGTAA